MGGLGINILLPRGCQGTGTLVLTCTMKDSRIHLCSSLDSPLSKNANFPRFDSVRGGGGVPPYKKKCLAKHGAAPNGIECKEAPDRCAGTSHTHTHTHAHECGVWYPLRQVEGRGSPTDCRHVRWPQCKQRHGRNQMENSCRHTATAGVTATATALPLGWGKKVNVGGGGEEPLFQHPPPLWQRPFGQAAKKGPFSHTPSFQRMALWDCP